MLKNSFLNKVITGDVLNVLPEMQSSSVDLILTDPPYFLDKLDNTWQEEKVNNSRNKKVIKSLPAGMKFNRSQGLNFYSWYLRVSNELFRILKPGGFFFSFSSPRLYHRMASAIDDAGFELRDCFLWLYTQNQAKVMGLNHFIDKTNLDKKEKEKLKKEFNGWKIPQIKSCFEPIAVAQKPTDGTFLSNFIKNKIGLFNTNVRVGDNMFPSNVLSIDKINDIIDRFFLIKKPNKDEKGSKNIHLTVKPLELCEHLIKLSAFHKDIIVLDPFLGSGTTAVAAKKLGLNYVGIDINQEYIRIAEQRLASIRIDKDIFEENKVRGLTLIKQSDIFDLMPRYSKI